MTDRVSCERLLPVLAALEARAIADYAKGLAACKSIEARLAALIPNAASSPGDTSEMAWRSRHRDWQKTERVRLFQDLAHLRASLETTREAAARATARREAVERLLVDINAAATAKARSDFHDKLLLMALVRQTS